jgi:hypothetical protein
MQIVEELSGTQKLWQWQCGSLKICCYIMYVYIYIYIYIYPVKLYNIVSMYIRLPDKCVIFSPFLVLNSEVTPAYGIWTKTHWITGLYSIIRMIKHL